MKTANPSLQQKFFDYLKVRSNNSGKILVTKVQEILNLRQSAAYKKIRGDSQLNLDDVASLANAFNVSIDDIIFSSNRITFKHPFMNEEESRRNFINQFDYYLAPLDRKDGKSLTFLANELPLFYYFNHPHIFHFMVSVWTHLHWSEGKLEIDNSLKYDEQLKKFREATRNRIANIDVTEIWNSNMLNNLFQQIIFSITIRAFKSRAYISDLINDIDLLIQGFRNVTEKKRDNLNIYINEFGNYLDVVTYNSKSLKATFIGFDYPKFIVSENQSFYEYAQLWTDKIRKRSVLVSGEGYQYQELFFHKLEIDFASFKNKVDKLVGVYYE